MTVTRSQRNKRKKYDDYVVPPDSDEEYTPTKIKSRNYIKPKISSSATIQSVLLDRQSPSVTSKKDELAELGPESNIIKGIVIDYLKNQYSDVLTLIERLASTDEIKEKFGSGIRGFHVVAMRMNRNPIIQKDQNAYLSLLKKHIDEKMTEIWRDLMARIDSTLSDSQQSEPDVVTSRPPSPGH